MKIWSKNSDDEIEDSEIEFFFCMKCLNAQVFHSLSACFIFHLFVSYVIKLFGFFFDSHSWFF